MSVEHKIYGLCLRARIHATLLVPDASVSGMCTDAVGLEVACSDDTSCVPGFWKSWCLGELRVLKSSKGSR